MQTYHAYEELFKANVEFEEYKRDLDSKMKAGRYAYIIKRKPEYLRVIKEAEQANDDVEHVIYKSNKFLSNAVQVVLPSKGLETQVA